MKKISVATGDSYIVLDVDKLIKSQSNVREKHSKEQILEMAISIRNRGVIHAPCVAKDGEDKYEIIAGMLRVLGCRAAEQLTVKCKDISHLDAAGRVEISLSENVHRTPMTSIDLHKAFDKLFKAGRSVEEIASRFNQTKRKVQQLLAIGGLPKAVLKLAELEQIGNRGLEALACATAKDVKRYLALAKNRRPREWEIENWLRGPVGWFPANNALFNLEDYKGGIVKDLFARDDDDTVLLTDGTQFMQLQDAALVIKLAEYEKKGYAVEEVEHWQQFAYDQCSKKNGGKVFWTRNGSTGEITFHVGYKRRGKAGKSPTAAKGKAEKKPETSQAFNDYLKNIRHQEVCDLLLTNKRKSMSVAILLIMKGLDNWHIRDELGQGIKSQAYIDSLNNSQIGKRLIEADNKLHRKLKHKGSAYSNDYKAIMQVLNRATLGELTGYMATLVATKWHVSYSGDNSNQIAKLIGVKQCDGWHADDAFWNGIKSKATLLAIAKENDIKVSEKATGSAIRKVLQKQVPDEWIPSWLTF